MAARLGTSFGFDHLEALEVLDSRGCPTVQVSVELTDGSVGVAGVPSGASTGSREAAELRDGDASRFDGRGVRAAVHNIITEIQAGLRRHSWQSLEQVDQFLISLDGTDDKGRLGANAIVGVSMATARALATSAGQELWEWLPVIGTARRFPVPCFNVINGGVHAPNPLAFQEFMICPLGAPSMPEAVQAGVEIYAHLRSSATNPDIRPGRGGS